MALSVSAAARAAGIDRGTWTGIEKGTRETEEYLYARVENVLGWAPGSIDAILDGGRPTLAAQQPATARPATDNGNNGNNGTPDAEIEFEIEMIQRSRLPERQKAELIKYARQLQQRQRAELEQIRERQAADRRAQIRTVIDIADAQGAT